MDIGIFQLLPAPETLSDREVIEQALWEVDCAETGGYDSIWIAEHHLASFGLVGAPSVYAAAVAQRTLRVGIGYAVAVLPLHHPLRLAEEIAWVDNLSQGRVLVGVGPGFSPYELGAFGVPLDERQARLEEGTAILRTALSQPSFTHAGRFWNIPRVTLRPRPYRGSSPPFLRASSAPESLRQAALDGVPLLLGLKPTAQIAECIAAYRACRSALGLSAAAIDREVAEFRVLRRVALAPSDGEALTDARQALCWENAVGSRVHGAGGGDSGANDGAAARLAGGTEVHDLPEVTGGCIGTPQTVLRELAERRALGIRHVIAWLSFGDLPYAKVRRSMELIRQEVIPILAAKRRPEAVAPAPLHPTAAGDPATGGGEPGLRMACARPDDPA